MCDCADRSGRCFHPPVIYLAVSLKTSIANPNPLIRKECHSVDKDPCSIWSAGKCPAGGQEELTDCCGLSWGQGPLHVLEGSHTRKEEKTAEVTVVHGNAEFLRGDTHRQASLLQND